MARRFGFPVGCGPTLDGIQNIYRGGSGKEVSLHRFADVAGVTTEFSNPRVGAFAQSRGVEKRAPKDTQRLGREET